MQHEKTIVECVELIPLLVQAAFIPYFPQRTLEVTESVLYVPRPKHLFLHDVVIQYSQ